MFDKRAMAPLCSTSLMSELLTQGKRRPGLAVSTGGSLYTSTTDLMNSSEKETEGGSSAIDQQKWKQYVATPN